MAGIPFFVLPLALGAIATGNARAEAPVTNLGEKLFRGVVWRTDGSGAIWARGDFGAARPIDFVGLLGANAQPGTTIRVRLGDSQASVDGAGDYDSGSLPFISPAISRDDGIYSSHLELPSVQVRRWWRIDISGHGGDFQASILVMGRKLQPARYYETTWQIEQRDLGSVSFGRNGVPNQARGARLRAMQFTLGWIDEDEAETMFQPFDEITGKTVPYLCCFDPEPTVKRQRRTFFGINEPLPALGKAAFNRFERKFVILSLF